MDSVCEGSDRAGIRVGGVMADDAPTCAILLLGDAHGSTGGSSEGGVISSVGDDGVVRGVKGYVAHLELLRSSAVTAAMTGVFANVQ